MVNSLTMADKLKALRKSKGYTQQDVANIIGTSRATVGGYEVGRRQPRLSDLKKLAELYGVGLDYFGVATDDEVQALLARAACVFASKKISKEEKDELYMELMRLYVKMSK